MVSAGSQIIFLDKQSETCQKKLQLQEIHSSLNFSENHRILYFTPNNIQIVRNCM